MKKVLGFKDSWILTEEGLKKTNLLIEDGRIKEIGSTSVEGLIKLPEDQIVIPGFIDQHIHGAGGSDAMDGTKEALSTIAQFLAKEGTTAFCATTMTQSMENIDKALNNVKEYMSEKHPEGA